MTLAGNDPEGGFKPQTRRAKQAGSAALDRPQASIQAAETALKDLRGEVSRDSRDLLKDVGTTLKDARRNLTRSRQRIVKDLEQIEQALVKGKARPATKPATSAQRASAARSPKGHPPHKLDQTRHRRAANRTDARPARGRPTVLSRRAPARALPRFSSSPVTRPNTLALAARGALPRTPSRAGRSPEAVRLSA
jgi:hypothetical protein